MIKKSSRVHYSWVILLCCCMIQAAALGAISNCKGVFYDAVCQDLNFALGTFTLQGVFMGSVSALITPLALKILNKHKMNRVLFWSCVLYMGTQVGMSFLGEQVLSWYLMAMLQAVGGAFLLFLPVPIIINRWFEEKRGLAMAVAASFSGISGMLLNPVYAKITEQYGWRAGYRFSGIFAFLLAGPILLTALRDNPKEMGLKPYGAGALEGRKERVQEAGKRLDSRGRLRFFCLLMIAFCLSCGSCFQSHLTKYGITLGIPLRLSAFLPSAAMLGSVVLKPVLGLLVDRFNAYRTAKAAFWLNILGFAAFLFSGTSMICLYAGSLFCGISMAGNVVLFPLLAEHALRGYDYERYYAYLSMVISMTGVSCGAVFGYVFDFAGSYIPVFVILLAVAIWNMGAFLLLQHEKI